jgi:hypothetical protein
MRKPAIPKQYLGAFKAGHRASAREFIDEDLSYSLLNKIVDSGYTDTESMETLAYIAKFNNEFHKNVIKKGDEAALHKDEDMRKDCYDRENSRNRDIMSRERNQLVSIEPRIVDNEGGEIKLDAFLNKARNLSNHEDVILDLLDSKNQEN